MNLNKVRGLRMSIPYTQEEMALALEMSKSTYQYKELNDTFTANDVKKMIEVFEGKGLDVQFPRDFY